MPSLRGRADGGEPVMPAAPATAGAAGLAVAFGAGVLSIAAPCSWPLIPGYLAYVSGVGAGDTSRVRRVMGASSLFVLGFAVVFTALGATASVLGALLLRHLPLLVKLAGAFVIVMGLATLGVLRIPLLYREKRFDLARVRSGPAGAIPLGMAFAFGWTPCIGPVLASILTAAAATNTAPWGAVLLVLYSMGLGIPFIALGLGFQRARGSLDWLRRHGRAIEAIGGAVLVGVGILFVSGAWRSFFVPLQRSFARLGWPPI